MRIRRVLLPRSGSLTRTPVLCVLFFFNESLILPLQPLNIIFVDNSRFHSAPCHLLQFIFFSFSWLCHQAQSPTFHSFQHSRLIVPRYIVCIEGPRSYCESTNTKLRLQHGNTSDTYPAPLPFHSLRYVLYDSVISITVVMGRSSSLAGPLT